MKKYFAAYVPRKTTFADIQKSVISFDTNSILNLYRFKLETAKEFLSSIKSVKNNVWLPYIVALEYNDLRTTVIKQEREYLDGLAARINKFKDEMLSLTTNRDHNLFPFDLFNEKIKSSTNELSKIIFSCQSAQRDLFRNDPIRDEIFSLFDEKIGEPISATSLCEIYKRASVRFSSKIPPGYMDEKNKSGREKLYGDTVIKTEYSDYIMWHELLEKTHKLNMPLILVTDEKKEDWILKVNGMNLGARPELITEMMIKSGQSFSIISSLEFISLMRSGGEVNISQESFDDIKKITTPTWKNVVINAFKSMGNTATLNELYHWIEINKPRPLTKEWKVTARKTVYYYCPDCDIYIGNNPLFEQIGNATYRFLGNDYEF